MTFLLQATSSIPTRILKCPSDVLLKKMQAVICIKSLKGISVLQELLFRIVYFFQNSYWKTKSL